METYKQQSPESELRIFKRNINELTKELEELRGQEKISEVEVPSLFDQINKKIIADIGPVSENELLEHLKEEKNDLIASVLNMVRATVGDLGNFEILEKASKITTTEGKHEYGDDTGRPYFDIGIRKIYMGPEAMRMITNPDIMVALLATKGSSGALNDLHHEFIHSLQVKEEQTNKDKLLNAINIFGDKNILLKEIHALIGADRKGNGKRIDINELHKTLSSDSYGLVSTEEDMHRLTSASIEIKRLYALGLSDDEVGKAVSRAKWDKKSETYDTLTSELKKIMREKHLSESDMADLVMTDELKTKIRIEKTRIAARNAILDFLE